LGDYFNVTALAKAEYNPYKIWDYVQAAKPVCAILDAYVEKTDRSFFNK
jgi:hypothetical protein